MLSKEREDSVPGHLIPEATYVIGVRMQACETWGKWTFTMGLQS